MIRLYRAPFSTNVERVALALAHKEIAVESVVIDYSDRSEVERVSGQGLVPVIDDAGTVVVDSMEIVRYLEERYPDPPLYPRMRRVAPRCSSSATGSTRSGSGRPTRSRPSRASRTQTASGSLRSRVRWRQRSTASRRCSPEETTSWAKASPRPIAPPFPS
ncbi:MAG: hypothetical protein AVDCRST_MAG45-2145 [uncultured Solirubrobacterales bacterium]|uniref:GST N-terminal domain-containing protein n=1 Tax=uncultured Solirubrobacterales bacterium TaxID=768556 RepID=A0A6J4T5Z6_9ACTN|nr:MAG: hypothetical protein AVDCRST_MAG45-2145 [uncultured Solirubrobacterales bacterium]